MSPEEVFIGTPTHICKRYCADEFTRALVENSFGASKTIVCNSLVDTKDYYNNPSIINVHLHNLGGLFYRQRGSIHRRLVASMNLLRDNFLSSDKKLFLSLESDVILGVTTLPRIINTINKNQDVDILHTNCYHNFNPSREFSLTDRMTLGCTAIRRKVLEQIKFRYDMKILKAFHDAFFGFDAMQAGFKIYYDPDTIVTHVNKSIDCRGWNELPGIERR